VVVDDAGHQGQAAGVDRLAGGTALAALVDRRDTAIFYRHVGQPAGRAGAVVDHGAANQQFVHCVSTSCFIAEGSRRAAARFVVSIDYRRSRKTHMNDDTRNRGAAPSWPKVAVFGAGAVGCYFGARLAEAGAPVTLIARPAH